MAVAFRSGSTGGNLVSQSAAATTVPAGAAIGDVVVVYLATWVSSAAFTVTPPTGFTQKGANWGASDGASVNSVWWKRLVAADTGSYSFGMSAARWSSANALCFSGCVATGDPFDAVATPIQGTFGTVSSISVTTTDTGGGLVWAVYNDTSGTHTPPTSFTEVTDFDCGSTAYRIPGASGSQTASGGSISSSGIGAVWLGALLSAAGGGGTVTKQKDIPRNRARINRAFSW